MTLRGCGLHHVMTTGVMKISLSSVENWDTHQLVCLTSHNYDLFTNYNYDTGNWSFVGGTGNNKNIYCSGTETHLIDCPVQTLSYIPSCNYLLLKCRGYTLPTGRPTHIPTVSQTPVTTDSDTSLTGTTTDSGPSLTPVTTDSGTSLTGTQTTTGSGPSLTPVTTDSGTSLTGTQTTTGSGPSLTPVTTDPGTSLTSSQSTVPEVVSSPDITAPQSTSEDGPPLAALATASSLVAVVIIIVAVILLIALITYKRNKLNQQKHGYVIL